MDRDQARKRIDQLTDELNRHAHLYSVLDAPEISDEQYDAMLVELGQLESEFPELKRSDSPSQRVGAPPLAGFEVVQHAVPMLSLDKSFDTEELIEFDRRLKRHMGMDESDRIAYVCELKIDGLAVSLRYEGGMLTLGSTRGDGRQGEDVTANLRTVMSVPLQLQGDPPEVFEARGEVYLSHDELSRINTEREAEDEPPFVNPRNAAAGTIRQLDSAVAAARGLDIFVYGTGEIVGAEFATHSEELELLARLGFKLNPHIAPVTCIEEAVEYCAGWIGRRGELGYDVDGVVVKADSMALQREAGATSHGPRWATAFKFPAVEVETVVTNIEVTVARTGQLTPVAVMEPVFVDGSTVSRAALHNADEVARKDIRVGDHVVLRKAGDVIPEILRSLPDKRTGDERVFEMPGECPVCGTEVVREEDASATRCPNLNCPARKLALLTHWAGRQAMDIDGLGPAVAEQLIERGLVDRPLDLYTLDTSQVAELERMGEQSAQNLIAAIDASRGQGLARVLFALGILHVGRTAAARLAERYGSLAEVAAAEQEELEEIADVGPKIAASLRTFFDQPENQRLPALLAEVGVEAKSSAPAERGNELSGLSFVFTGTLERMTRDEAAVMVGARGGRATSSVSSKTDYGVAGPGAGSKLDKARDLGIAVLTESEFLDMVRDGE